MQVFVVGVPLAALDRAVGLAARGIAADEIFDCSFDAGPVFLEEQIVGTVEGLAVGFQDTACMAVDGGMFARRMMGRGKHGPIVDAAIGRLLIHEVDPPHSAFDVGEESGEALLIAPDVRAGRLAAAVRAFPTVGFAVGDLECHADVPRRAGLRRDAIQHPIRKRAVVERLAKQVGPLLEHRKFRGRFVNHRVGVRPECGVVATHRGRRPAVVVLWAVRVFVRIPPRQQEGDFDAAAGGHVDGRGDGPVDGAPRRCWR